MQRDSYLLPTKPEQRVQITRTLLERCHIGLPFRSSPLRLRHLMQFLFPLIQKLLEKHQNLILITQLIEIRLHPLQILISIRTTGPFTKIIIITAFSRFRRAIVRLLALPITHDPRLLPLPELSNIAEEIVGLPLSHIAIDLEEPGLENMLETVEPGVVVFAEEGDGLLEEAEAADDFLFRENEVVDVLLVGGCGGGVGGGGGGGGGGWCGGGSIGGAFERFGFQFALLLFAEFLDLSLLDLGALEEFLAASFFGEGLAFLEKLLLQKIHYLGFSIWGWNRDLG